MTLSRRSFVGRALGIGAAFAFPGLAPAAPAPVAPPQPLAPLPLREPALTEWWFESTDERDAPPGAVELIAADGSLICRHYTRPGTGIYYQYPPGREPPAPAAVKVIKDGKTIDHFPLPRSREPYMVHGHAGYFGLVVA